MPGRFLAMSRVIESIERRQMRPNIPQFKAGDTVRVHFQVIEGQRRRTQVFEGIVIKRQGSGVHETFTVRKQSFGVGVERTFPIHSPKIERIELAAIGVVRRAKLYYLRDKVGKRARVRTKAGAVIAPTVVVEPEPAEPQPEPTEAEADSDELAAAHDEAEVEASPEGAAEPEAAAEPAPGDEPAPETESK
jgi:large subunit ribosomal protein L19